MPAHILKKSIAALVISLTGFLFLGATGVYQDNKIIAVFPVYNISGSPAPIKEIREALSRSLRAEGLNTLENEVVDGTLEKYRIRYLGGIDLQTATSFREASGVDAILITSLELYSERTPPKLAITSRLVSTEDSLDLLWMDDAGLSGDDSPGLLGLSRIDDPDTLIQKAAGYLSSSLAGSLGNRAQEMPRLVKRKRFQPKVFYRSRALTSDMHYRIAVLPFYNRSDRKYAGDIMSLHFARWLMTRKNLSVIEPGVAYRESLQSRIIMDDGLSLSNAELLFNKMDADLIVTGNVMDYQDYIGSYDISGKNFPDSEDENTPVYSEWSNIGEIKVDFSIQIIERTSLEVIWSSRSYNQGDKGIHIFDIGKEHTALALASQMVEYIVGMLFE